MSDFAEQFKSCTKQYALRIVRLVDSLPRSASARHMDLTVESGLLKQQRVADLVKEGEEITAMIVASINTARRNLKQPPKT